MLKKNCILDQQNRQCVVVQKKNKIILDCNTNESLFNFLRHKINEERC